MTPEAELEGVRIVPYSDAWTEGYVDLSIGSDMRDPLYEQPSRDDVRARLELHRSSGLTKAHVLAIEEGRVVGSARVNLVKTCGEAGKAYLSLLVDQEHRGRGIGGRLLDRVCDAMAAQGVEWVEMGMLDAWRDWRRFLEARGFEPTNLTSADAVFPPDAGIPARLPEVGAAIRPIRLPGDKAQWIEFVNAERLDDLPDACAVRPDGPMHWEVEPRASWFDPEGFLLAVDPDTGELVGSVEATVVPEEGPRGIVEGPEVARQLLDTGLRLRLLFEAVGWLRGKGVTDIRSRIHPSRRDEEALFRSAGFSIQNAATIWRKRTHGSPPKSH